MSMCGKYDVLLVLTASPKEDRAARTCAVLAPQLFRPDTEPLMDICTCMWYYPEPEKQTEKNEAALTFIREVNSRYEQAAALTSSSGPYFYGADISIVDIAILPFLSRFTTILNLYRGIDVLVRVRLCSLWSWVCVAFDARCRLIHLVWLIATGRRAC